MMSITGNPRSPKILLLDLSDLPTKELHLIVVHCPTVSDLAIQTEKYPSHALIIACRSNNLNDLIPVLSDITLDALYIWNIGEKLNASLESWWLKTTIVHNDKQLMRHLCTKSVLCFYSEGLEHKKNGDAGVANRCLLDASHVLNYARQFV
ncbi:hypothetical protein I4U23_023564 [Adineta vaga]|nr:hypothetical protein I4U23_023564 [Adineta vaga]